MAGSKDKTDSNGQYEPKILVFACNWCSYAGADTAGVSRIQYSPKFRVIRVMCSGRVRASYILKAFQLGADGVLISGCHIGDCHYIFGNHRALEMYDRITKTLKVLGFEDKRIRLEWVSAAEGIRWAEVIDEFVEQIHALGPSPINRKNSSAAKSAAEIEDALEGNEGKAAGSRKKAARKPSKAGKAAGKARNG